MPAEGAYTGRCYCGRVALRSAAAPQIIAYCHCSDCRRWTGGPVGAFAAFPADALTATPTLGAPFSAVEGVDRWSCADCGSPLAARFDYLPDQVYVPLGVLDQADALAPQMHCHNDARLPWLGIQDDLPCATGSGRDALNNHGHED